MYSVTMGLVHPRINDKRSQNYSYIDFSENISDLHILQNLMSEVLNVNKSNNIIDVFEEFFQSRSINSKTNKHYQKIVEVFVEYHKWYMGTKGSAFNFYLVKRDLEKNIVTDVITTWKTYRETK